MPGVEGTLSPLVFAERTRPGGTTHPWQWERRGWRRAVRDVSRGAELLITADVQDCFASIGEPALSAAARHMGGDASSLLRYARRFRALGIGGLPVGPRPSAVAANAVLSIADEAARSAGILPVRWVDDVLFAGGRADVVRAHRAWRRALRELGLRDNPAKFHVYRDPDEAIDALGARASLWRDYSRGIIRVS